MKPLMKASISSPIKWIFLAAILVVIVIGLIMPDGIRAAFANNVWSLKLIHISGDLAGLSGLESYPTTHRHAGLLLAHQALQSDQYDLAKSYLKPLVDAGNYLAIDTYAEIHYLQADYTTAFSLWEKSKDIQALIQAMAFQITSRDPQLSTAASKALYGIDHERFTNAYVDHLDREGKLDVALDVLDRSIQEFPRSENLATWYFLSGVFYKKQQDLSSANRAFNNALKVDPAYKDAWRELGLLFFQAQNDTVNSIACFEKFIAVDPANAGTYFIVAWDFLSIGQNLLAIQSIEKAILLKSADPNYYLRAGLIYEYSGLLHQALTAYGTVLEIDPGNASAQEGLQRLSQNK